jgi:hypothetical protein
MGPNDPLFLNHSGTGSADMRKAVTSFFNQTLNLHITSTTLRSIVETTFHNMQVSDFILEKLFFISRELGGGEHNARTT